MLVYVSQAETGKGKSNFPLLSIVSFQMIPEVKDFTLIQYRTLPVNEGI